MINCGYYELDIDDVGTRFFRLSLTQNINQNINLKNFMFMDDI